MRRYARYIPRCAISNVEEVEPGQTICILDLDDVHLNLEQVTTAAVYGIGDKNVCLLQHDAEDNLWQLAILNRKSGVAKVVSSGVCDVIAKQFESVSRTRILRNAPVRSSLAA